jgi:hypothetical protein
MNIILQRMNELSDTELRVLLVIIHTDEPLSVADIQQKTNRGRQVYEAVKTLGNKNVIAKSNLTIVDNVHKWNWKCLWQDAPPIEIDFLPEFMQPSVATTVELPFAMPEEAPVVTNKKESTRKPATKKESTANPNQQHSAVKTYVEITHRRPKHIVANAIASAIPDSETELNAWKDVVTQWVLSGYNPMNVDGMIDMYKNKGSLQQNRQQRRKIVLNPVSTKSPEEEMAKLQAYFLENNAYLHEEEPIS